MRVGLVVGAANDKEFPVLTTVLAENRTMVVSLHSKTVRS